MPLSAHRNRPLRRPPRQLARRENPVEDDDTADGNLRQLLTEIAGMATTPLWHEATWVFCDRCGSSVDTDLIHPDGYHYSDDGDFYCDECWRVMP